MSDATSYPAVLKPADRGIARVASGLRAALSTVGASGLVLTAMGFMLLGLGAWPASRHAPRAPKPGAWVSAAVGWRGHRA